MKFLLFADLHHHPGIFMGGTWEDLRLMQRRAEEEQCDFIIHAGDFCHGPTLVPDYVQAYNDFHIPSYHVLGNHDSDKTPFEETLKLYHMPNDYYFFDVKGYRMIVLNPNCYYLDGEYIHYSMGNYFAHGALRDYMPPEQLQWLEETIAASPFPCILISHESFERPDGVKNREAVLEIIRKANQNHPGRVILCINGHHHRDFIRILDQVCFLEMNSASFDWLENTHTLFPEEMCKEIYHLNHTVVYNDPLYAIVTLEGSEITIQGTESSMFMGVTREMTGNPPFDKAGRPVTPRVQSAKIKLG